MKKVTEKIRNNLIEALKQMSDDEIVEVYRIYCEYNNYMDDFVYRMEELNEVLGNIKPLSLAKKIFFGKFNPEEKYFYYDGSCDLVSFNSPTETTSPIYIGEIADCIIDVAITGASVAASFKAFNSIKEVLKEGEE